MGLHPARDLPCGGAPVVLLWRKRRWRCRTEDCPWQTFTERVAQLPGGMRTTTRLREAVARAVEDGRISPRWRARSGWRGRRWDEPSTAVTAYAQRELGEPQPTAVLGLDETRFGRPRWMRAGQHDDGRTRWVRTDPWEIGFVDLAGCQGLLGQVDGRRASAVCSWLAQRSRAFRDAIEVVVIDPCAPYAADPAWANRRLLLRRRERLSPGPWPGCGTAASTMTPPGRS